MKKYLLLFFSFVTCLGAEPLARPPFEFDRDKIARSEDVVALYRATADYFYVLSKHNRDRLGAVRAFAETTGWCAGDAHPDNFGALAFEGQASLFALDDMDDAGPCPLVMDLERFLLGASYAGGRIADLLPSYLAGTRGQAMEAPGAIRKLLEKSEERGTHPDPDDLDGHDTLRRRKNAREMTETERRTVREAVGEKPEDVYATAKCGGGSHGLLRYEMLFAHPRRVLELKTLVAPAVTVVAPYLPPPAERIARTLALERDGRADPVYRVVEVNGAPMLLRPRLHGNVGAKVFDLSAGDRADVLGYEAYRLGQLHAHSKPDWAAALDARTLAADVESLRAHFDGLYGDFKPDRNCHNEDSSTN